MAGSSSLLVDDRIGKVGGWQGRTLSQVRAPIKEADPAVVEEIKWKKPTNPGQSLSSLTTESSALEGSSRTQ